MRSPILLLVAAILNGAIKPASAMQFDSGANDEFTQADADQMARAVKTYKGVFNSPENANTVAILADTYAGIAARGKK